MWRDADGDQEIDANERFYYLQDDMYNVLGVTDSNGDLVERYTYGDYGAPTIYDASANTYDASPIGNPYLFNGRRYDPGTGLYYYRTRYLDPELGRFSTRDTIGLWGDESNLGNPYSYVGNNPWSRLDPFGEMSHLFYGDTGQAYLRKMGDEHGKTLNAIAKPAIDYWNCLDSTTQYRILGVVQLVGSTTEVVGGAVGIVVTSPTGVGIFVNGTLVVHGADGVQAAIRQLASGQPAGTVTEYLLTKGTGNKTVGTVGDAAIGFVNPVRGATRIAGPLIAADKGADVVGGVSRGSRHAVTGASRLGRWSSVNEGMSQRARFYQAQISGRVDEAFVIDTVHFDGIRGDVLLEAKGPGYETFVKDGVFQSYFSGAERMVLQAEDQLSVAGGNVIEWHIAEEAVAEPVNNLFDAVGISGITVIHTPAL